MVKKYILSSPLQIWKSQSIEKEHIEALHLLSIRKARPPRHVWTWTWGISVKRKYHFGLWCQSTHRFNCTNWCINSRYEPQQSGYSNIVTFVCSVFVLVRFVDHWKALVYQLYDVFLLVNLLFSFVLLQLWIVWINFSKSWTRVFLLNLCAS